MQKLVRIIALASVVVLGIWGWQVLFPNAERVIKSRLSELAETVSFDANDGNFSRIYKTDKVSEFFTLDVEVTVDVRGYSGTHTLNGKTEIKQALLGAQQQLRGLKVEFLDITVTVNPDKETAVAHMTAQANIAGDRDFHIQELSLSLRKVEGKWQIYKIETVKTLSGLNFPRPLTLAQR